MRVELFPQQGWPQRRRRQWYIRLIASNGKTLAVSEAYATRWNAKRAARKNFPGLEIKEVPS